MSDGEGAHEVIAAIAELKRFGFTDRDLAEVCMIPDCYCDGNPHD
jgi:hypothetical protein